MKINLPTKGTPATLLAVAMIAAGAATTAGAATDLQGRLALRPFTPSDQSDYNLKSLQQASGMRNIGIGQPAYLEALVNIAITPSDITNVTWTLTSAPVGSQAALQDSPLPSNVPVYYPADALVSQIAGRKMLRPDVTGQYVVTATIDTASSGSTNVTQTIIAGTYMGLNTCSLCHSGGLIADNVVAPWSGTLHATKFTRSIDGLVGSYSASCIACHTLGYDVNTNAVNGGFDDVAKQLGWTFPTPLTNGNWANKVPAQLKNVANIQCENCHGAGSEHAYGLGDTSKISVMFDVGNCAVCHDAKSHHIKVPEWKNSRHAIVTTHPSGPGEESCVGCHTGIGFAARMAGMPTTNTAYMPITCAGCHDPHDASKPYQLRNVGPVTLKDGTTVANYGTAEICMNCHMSRQNATNYVETTAGSSRFGPHHGPQTDMFLGVNGITYGKTIPSSAHRDVITNACVTCHMQETPATTDPAFLKAGGHTWNMSYVNTNGATVDMTEACSKCHGEVEEFNFARADYDGNGVIEGIQTEVKGLLNKLAVLLPPAGVAKSNINITSSWTKPQLRAGYNYLFVTEDKSFGIHNAAFAVGLLKASIADLSGDANNDGIPDWWQIKYFGSVTSPNAAPNANPSGDGIPNWLKYSLNLDPTVGGIAVPGGVVWANGSAQITPGSTNAVQIFTAAEVAFTTQVGKTYQVQSISTLGGGWLNVGAPIQGNGQSMSYLTPTRNDGQQFYRVISTP